MSASARSQARLGKLSVLYWAEMRVSEVWHAGLLGDAKYLSQHRAEQHLNCSECRGTDGFVFSSAPS